MDPGTPPQKLLAGEEDTSQPGVKKGKTHNVWVSHE